MGRRRSRGVAGLAGLALALGASAAAAAGDYEWPVVAVIDGATLVVDAGADIPPELAMLRVRLRGAGTEDAAALSAALAGASTVVVRNPRYGGRDCECQVVADVAVDGVVLGGR